jgi:hypothetical protein
MIILIHVASVLYVFSYLVKDITWLRVLTVVAGLTLLWYCLRVPMPLWRGSVGTSPAPPG